MPDDAIGTITEEAVRAMARKVLEAVPGAKLIVTDYGWNVAAVVKDQTPVLSISATTIEGNLRSQLTPETIDDAIEEWKYWLRPSRNYRWILRMAPWVKA